MAKAPEDWTATFRRQVRARTAQGWGVFQERGNLMRLQVRDATGSASVTLPYGWDLGSTPDALRRIELIYRQVCEGQTLKGAASIVDNASSRTRLDWREALERFHREKTERGTVIKPTTWRLKYEPTLERAVALLESRRPPTSSEDLLDLVLAKWPPASRSRQIAAQNLAQFLGFAVQRLKFPGCWMPPAKLRHHVGARPHGQSKRIGYPLTDAQILRLLDNLPAGEHVAPWRFALQLMAAYGLRPEELRYLKVRQGQLWCLYQKKGGGGQTDPRPLYPLPARDLDGTAVEWNLPLRLQAGEALPPLGQPGHAGEALITFLRRVPVWRSLREEVAGNGEVLVPYSFRHRFAAEAHRLGLTVKDIATAMGHSVEAHLRAYSGFASTTAASAFAAAVAKADEAQKLVKA
jgi:integrase